MANELKILDKDQLAQLWTKCLNTFAQRPGLDPQVAIGNLYHLGVYDSYVDNNDGTITITRQTGYISWKYLMERTVQPGGSGNYYYFVIDDSIYYDLATNYSFVNSYGLTNSAFSPVNSGTINNALAFVSSGTNDSRLCIRKTDSITSVETLMSWVQANKLLVQYKKATSYTEKVIKNQSLNTLNASGSAWIQNEYDKTVNLYNINNGLNDGSNNWYVYLDFKEKGNYYLKINTTIYRLIMYYSNDDGNSWNILFDANNTYERSFSITNTSYKYILYLYITSSSAINPSNYSTYEPMINKGSTPLPYQEYGGGEIAHKEDIEPVLLWENGSPRSSFAAQPISMAQGITNFKYLYIEVSLQTSSGQGNMIFKFRSKVSNNNYLTIFDNGSSATHSTRAFTITSTTNINVSACSNGNEYCIPLRIFGSNI